MSSHALNCTLLPGTYVLVEEKKNKALMEYKIKPISSPLFKFSDKCEDEQNDPILGKMDEITRKEGKGRT